MNFEKLLPFILATTTVGVCGLFYGFWKSYSLNKKNSGDERVVATADSIKNAVIEYMSLNYKAILLFVISTGILTFFYGKYLENTNGIIAGTVLIGALSSAVASMIGARVAGNASGKVANEAQKSYSKGFKTVMSASNSVAAINVSSVLVGLGIVLIALRNLNLELDMVSMLNIVSGYALGASVVAIFNRLGGGVFSKGSDIAETELIESDKGITAKSPYNASSVANEAGQVVSNVAGIGSGLFESLAIALVASIILGVGMVSETDEKTLGLLTLPLVISALGVLTSICGSFFLSSSEVATSRKSINFSYNLASIVLVGGIFGVIRYTLPVEWQVENISDTETVIMTYKGWGIFWSAVFGVAASIGLGYITKYFTGKESVTVKRIVGKTTKGAAENVLGGIEAGLVSTALPMAVIIAVALASYYFTGFYGVGIASVAFLANKGLHFAFNAFAPIADNSNSVALKADMDSETVSHTDNLKQVGLQSLAQGKIYMVAATALSSLALFSAFIQLTGVGSINVASPIILAALGLGAVLPVLFSSNALAAVRRVGKIVMSEVKRQFTEVPALDEAKDILDKYNGDLSSATEGEKEIVYAAQESTDNENCIEKAGYTTVWETLVPGAIAIAVPALTAWLGGAEMLAALLLGVIGTGTVMAIYHANTGSALESANYALEEGTVYNGEFLGKESNAYQASIDGKKVAKPLKDVASPAMTVLIKAMIVVAIVMVPLLINKAEKKKALQLDGLTKVEQNIKIEDGE